MGLSTVKKKIFVWGASGHASFVLNILSYYSEIEVVGVLDDISPQRVGEIFCGFKVLGGREVLPALKEQGVDFCLFGFGNCSARVTLAEYLKNEGIGILTAIHPDSSIAASASIGEGTVIGPGVVVDAGCTIESNCILNNNCTVSHGSIIHSGTHICPGVTIGGDVTVGRSSWVGIGSTVIQKINIGPGAYVGAGSVVNKDIPAGMLAHGVPAKIIRAMVQDF